MHMKRATQDDWSSFFIVSLVRKELKVQISSNLLRRVHPYIASKGSVKASTRGMKFDMSVG